MVKQKYNIPHLLASVVGYKGLPFPAAFLRKREGSSYSADGLEITDAAPTREELINGTRLRKQDERGIWYFMPVFFRHKDIKARSDARGNVTDNTIELPNAIISVTGKKTIVETPMVGRKGSVKELISVDDNEVSIAAFIQSPDGTYPEAEISQIRDLFNINESVELISALTDLIFDEGDKVVITGIEFPATPGVEDGQAIRIECVTDKEFELIID